MPSSAPPRWKPPSPTFASHIQGYSVLQILGGYSKTKKKDEQCHNRQPVVGFQHDVIQALENHGECYSTQNCTWTTKRGLYKHIETHHCGILITGQWVIHHKLTWCKGKQMFGVDTWRITFPSQPDGLYTNTHWYICEIKCEPQMLVCAHVSTIMCSTLSI